VILSFDEGAPAVGENARLGPLVFVESRTPTMLAANATSTQVVPLPIGNEDPATESAA
jgi:hypothetical protein